MEERKETAEVRESWQAPRLTWRCCICKKVEGQDTGKYTDGFCVACLWTHHTEMAVPVLALMVADGIPLR